MGSNGSKIGRKFDFFGILVNFMVVLANPERKVFFTVSRSFFSAKIGGFGFFDK